MTLEELNAIVDGVSKPFREQLDAANQRIAQLEQRLLSVPAQVPIDVEAIAERAAALIPKPKDGIDGANGNDGKDGRDGIDGANGKDGIEGKAGLDGAAGPQGERGQAGESVQGPKGDIGERGLDGKDGTPGKDAILPDIDAMVQRAFDLGFAKTAVEIERKAHDMFQRAIDKMPLPKDGKDAFELGDLIISDDGHGNVTLTFSRGDLKRSHTFRVPCFEYRGVWVDGESYRSGNGVSFGGSFWIATKDDAQGKPGDRDTDWILAVKKGRDARDPAKLNPPPEGPVKL